MQRGWVSEKKHATSLHQKITQPLHTQNHTTSQQKTLRESQNAALRTSYRLSKVSNNSFQSTEKVLKKEKKVTVVTAVRVVTVVKKKSRNLSKNSIFFNTFWKSNLTHLTTNVMFSGQHFAILAMFLLLIQCGES